jgi:hypothetical protein
MRARANLLVHVNMYMWTQTSFVELQLLPMSGASSRYKYLIFKFYKYIAAFITYVHFFREYFQL